MLECLYAAALSLFVDHERPTGESRGDATRARDVTAETDDHGRTMFFHPSEPLPFLASCTLAMDAEALDAEGQVLALIDPDPTQSLQLYQKRAAVESFRRLNFQVVAAGDSFNDVSMLKAAHGEPAEAGEGRRAAVAEQLRALGHQVVIEPLLTLVWLDGPEPDLDQVQALLATSANGVGLLALASLLQSEGRLGAAGQPHFAPAAKSCICICVIIKRHLFSMELHSCCNS